MAGSVVTSFLDLTIGPYRLALRTSSVVTVAHDVAQTVALPWRGGELPCLDLCAFMLGSRRDVMSFVVAVEAPAPHLPVAIGVDTIGHLQGADAPQILPLPRLGLVYPRLFEGALRLHNRLLLLLDTAQLSELVRAHLPPPPPSEVAGVASSR